LLLLILLLITLPFLLLLVAVQGICSPPLPATTPCARSCPCSCWWCCRSVTSFRPQLSHHCTDVCCCSLLQWHLPILYIPIAIITAAAVIACALLLLRIHLLALLLLGRACTCSL
jgi:hypothetical protein